MAGAVILVCGPPAAGKTTYVTQHAAPGDLVLDQDVIGATAMRRALAALPARTTGTAWVIRCAPGPARRAALAAQLGAARTVLLVPDRDVLLARAAARPRPRRAVAQVGDWFRREQANPAPRSTGQPRPARTTTQRGYGAGHRRLRATLLPDAYGQLCHHCGQPMLRGQSLDLDHTTDRGGYRGMAHAACNRGDGARKRWSSRSPSTSWTTSRTW